MKKSILALATMVFVLALATPCYALLPPPANQIPLQPGERARFEKAAQAGDKGAQLAMAEINADWDGEKPDYIAALYWFDQARKNTSPAPNVDYRFWDASIDVNGLKQFIADHAALYASAKGGNPQALYDFAWHRPHNAAGVSGDAPMPHWLLLAARAGHAKAQAQIGFLYLRAYFARRARFPYPIELVLEQFKPEDLEDISAPLRFNEPIDFDDEGTQTDIANAIAWLGKAAETGDPKAQFNLGVAYAISGPTGNMTAASQWLHRALASDPTLPVTACDLDLTGGISVGPVIQRGARPDYAAAFHCYDSVKQDHVGAYLALGYMYHHGIGIRRDDDAAIRMLNEAARHSDWKPAALYELSQLYDDSPKRRDPVKAVVLLTEARMAPVTPAYSCHQLIGQIDDVGGPEGVKRYIQASVEYNLPDAYRALSRPQRNEVRKQFKDDALALEYLDGYIPPVPFPDACV